MVCDNGYIRTPFAHTLKQLKKGRIHAVLELVTLVRRRTDRLVRASDPIAVLFLQ